MKLLIKTFFLIVAGMLVTMMLLVINNYTTHINDLNLVVRSAVNETQIVMMENIEDRYFGLANAREVINSEDDYLSLFKENLEKFANENDVYLIEDYYVDSSKGMIYVDVSCQFKVFGFLKKKINRKLINIIDVVG